MTSRNTNVLAGLRCVSCGSYGRFGIETTCYAVVGDDGIDLTQNHEWEEDSYCKCLGCGFTATIEGFTEEGEGEGEGENPTGLELGDVVRSFCRGCYYEYSSAICCTDAPKEFTILEIKYLVDEWCAYWAGADDTFCPVAQLTKVEHAHIVGNELVLGDAK